MVSERNRTLLRAFVDTFPPLKIALKINDCICYLVQSLLKCIWNSAKYIFGLILGFIYKFFSTFRKQIPFFRPRTDTQYERIKGKPRKQHTEPVPYRNKPFKRLLTYQGSLLLGALLYIFVYYVLIKHSTYLSITIAFLIMLSYMVVLENSHNIRSIIMLCLPIMFTNRGRALVFCSMLAIMVSGPLKNSQFNINELDKSLTCCRQYLIIKTDKVVDQNLVSSLVRVEDVIFKLVENIKEFAQQLKERFRELLQLALAVERYIVIVIEKLKAIVEVCNSHTQDVYNNCLATFKDAYTDCKNKLGVVNVICEIVSPLDGLCQIVKLPNILCDIPRSVIQFIDSTIGERLRFYIQKLENEFYVDIEVEHEYSFNGTKTKSLRKALREVKFDVEQKFWYVHLVRRVFNLITLILVIWILTTATLYHLNYLTELSYDNMYIDEYLKEIDDLRRKKEASLLEYTEDATSDSKSSSRDSLPNNASLNQNSHDQVVREKIFLFPLPKQQDKMYPKPFSIWMNSDEQHKLCIAGLVWAVIVGYIFFYVLLDFSLYKLIVLIDNILREILFTGDLPLVDVSSNSDGRVVNYNRTQLHQLREKLKMERLEKSQSYRNGSLSGMYRKLLDSIENNIPDDVAILDSLEQCLPKPMMPVYRNYENLALLALFTFIAVIVEAYALRTRHCIANLYYPKRARSRAVWLYQKLLRERPKYDVPEKLEEEAGTKMLEFGIKQFANRIKR